MLIMGQRHSCGNIACYGSSIATSQADNLQAGANQAKQGLERMSIVDAKQGSFCTRLSRGQKMKDHSTIVGNQQTLCNLPTRSTCY